VAQAVGSVGRFAAVSGKRLESVFDEEAKVVGIGKIGRKLGDCSRIAREKVVQDKQRLDARNRPVNIVHARVNLLRLERLVDLWKQLRVLEVHHNTIELGVEHALQAGLLLGVAPEGAVLNDQDL
jgi:hypothetical protein